MKKAEAISILATSVRPREAKDRARYDEAVKMAIEALKSSKRTAESAQNVQDGSLNWAIPILSNLVPASVVADAVQNQRYLEESMHQIKQLTGIGIDDLIDLFAKGYELKAPSAQPEIIRCKDCKHYIPYEWMFDGLSRSSNIDDYSPDEIGCSVNDHNYPPDGFCSCAERR